MKSRYGFNTYSLYDSQSTPEGGQLIQMLFQDVLPPISPPM
jgi:hypothetical protein